MRSFTLLGLFAGLLFAQDIQSKPFTLSIQSSKKTLDGVHFSTCHCGAAIESLCILKDTNTTFTLNTTRGETPGKGGLAGALVWTLPSQPPVSSAMIFYSDPSTNVALPLLFPGRDRAQIVGFDDKGFMNIVSYLDDRRVPPTGQTPRVLTSWYICDTYFTGYTYKTLAWVLGAGKPQNPSCIKVSVKRSFV